MIAEVLVPEELNFLWQLWIGEPVDGSQRTTLARVEPARWDVYVLGFNFEPATAPPLGPLRRCGEQRCPQAPSTGMGRHAKVPDNREIAATFQHEKARCLDGDCRTTNVLAIQSGREETPVREVEPPRPVCGARRSSCASRTGSRHSSGARARSALPGRSVSTDRSRRHWSTGARSTSLPRRDCTVSGAAGERRCGRSKDSSADRWPCAVSPSSPSRPAAWAE